MAPPLLHVVGAGPWQLATIRRARQLGCRVLATDGLPGRPGFAEADCHALADIADPEATVAAARHHAVDGVLCDTTDNGVLAAAHVAEQLGLPGIPVAAARCCTDKALMTAAAEAAGLPVPRSEVADDPAQALAAALRLQQPWIVKPVDNQSGRGVTSVSGAAGLAAAVAAAFAHSRRRRVLVQEQRTGLEVIVDSLVCDGVVHVLGVSSKLPYADNPTLARRIVYGPQTLPVAPALIHATNTRLLRALGLGQGLVHAEYMLSDGQVLPIDVAARGGGVHIYPVVLPHVSGVDAMQAAIDQALGRPCRVQARQPARAAVVEFLRAPPGRIDAFEGLDRARVVPGVACLHLNLQAGDEIGPLLDKDRRLGHLVTLADTVDEALAAASQAAGCISVRLQAA